MATHLLIQTTGGKHYVRGSRHPVFGTTQAEKDAGFKILPHVSGKIFDGVHYGQEVKLNAAGDKVETRMAMPPATTNAIEIQRNKRTIFNLIRQHHDRLWTNFSWETLTGNDPPEIPRLNDRRLRAAYYYLTRMALSAVIDANAGDSRVSGQLIRNLKDLNTWRLIDDTVGSTGTFAGYFSLDRNGVLESTCDLGASKLHLIDPSDYKSKAGLVVLETEIAGWPANSAVHGKLEEYLREEI